jgi:hypothetical protein
VVHRAARAREASDFWYFSTLSDTEGSALSSCHISSPLLPLSLLMMNDNDADYADFAPYGCDLLITNPTDFFDTHFVKRE